MFSCNCALLHGPHIGATNIFQSSEVGPQAKHSNLIILQQGRREGGGAGGGKIPGARTGLGRPKF